MASVVVNDEYLTDIADAIRAKKGTQDTYKPSQMAGAISSISGGGITPTGTIQITQNGTVDVTQYASANVNVTDWIDVTPDLSQISGGTTQSEYNSETDTLRVYITSSRGYSRADVPFTVEIGALYRMEFDLVSTATTCSVGFRDTTNDRVLFGLTRTAAGHFTYGTIVSDVSTFVDSDHVSIAFYCSWTTAAVGDATWKNFRIYKYVGGNS